MYYISPAMYLIGGVSPGILIKSPSYANHLELDSFDPPGRRACAFWTEFLPPLSHTSSVQMPEPIINIPLSAMRMGHLIPLFN